LTTQADEQIEAWIRTIAATEEIGFASPDDTRRTQCVGVYLMEVAAMPVGRIAPLPPLHLTLRYLITVRMDDPHEAHRLLGDLLFAAMEHPTFEVEPGSPPLALWVALGAVVRPAFVLRLPLRRERPQAAVSRVRTPLIVRGTAAVPLHGVVLGPGDAPVADALVEMPALRYTRRTDTHGRFVFPNVPAGTPSPDMRIEAKGYELRARATSPTSEREPLVIRFDFMEG